MFSKSKTAICISYRKVNLLVQCNSIETGQSIRSKIQWLEQKKRTFLPDATITINIMPSLGPYIKHPLQVKHVGNKHYRFIRNDIYGDGCLLENGKFFFKFEISPYDKSLFAALSIAYSATCHLKNILLLHAAAVKIGSRCKLLMGYSGAGKSTAADNAEKTIDGCIKFNDDVSELQFNSNQNTLKKIKVRSFLLVPEVVRPRDISVDLSDLYWISGWKKNKKKQMTKGQSIKYLYKALMSPLLDIQSAKKATDQIASIIDNYRLVNVSIRDWKSFY